MGIRYTLLNILGIKYIALLSILGIRRGILSILEIFFSGILVYRYPPPLADPEKQNKYFLTVNSNLHATCSYSYCYLVLLFLPTGAGSLIGIKTGKVIGYTTRSKRCATCQVATRTGRKAKSHDCRLN